MEVYQYLNQFEGSALIDSTSLDTSLIVTPVESNENTIYIAEIEFGNNSEMMTFLDNLEVDTEAILNSPVMIKEQKMYFQSIGDKKIVLLESPDDFSLLERYVKIFSELIDN